MLGRAALGRIPLGASGAANTKISGQSTTAAEGSIALTGGVGLAGQTATAGEGSIIPIPAAVLIGQGAAASQGLVIPTPVVVLAGQVATIGQGLIALTGGVGLAGQPAISAQGVLLDSDKSALTGQTTTTGIGSVSPVSHPEVYYPLVGAFEVSFDSGGFYEGDASLTASRGAIVPTVKVALTGQAAVTQQGNIVDQDKEGLTGQAGTCGQGALTLSVRRSIAGLPGLVQIGRTLVTYLPGRSEELLVGTEYGDLPANDGPIEIYVPTEQNVLYVLEEAVFFRVA